MSMQPIIRSNPVFWSMRLTSTGNGRINLSKELYEIFDSDLSVKFCLFFKMIFKTNLFN